MERGIALILTLLAGVAALVGEYTECTSHAEALEPVDLELSEKWRRLWKWYIGTYLGSVGSIVVVMIFGPLGLLVMLASIIGMMVVAILKLVYLWRTARTFREYEEMEA